MRSKKRKNSINKIPSCIHCINFKINFGLTFPYQCKLWEINTKNSTTPAHSIYRSTGTHCKYFSEKKATKEPTKNNMKNESDIDFIV